MLDWWKFILTMIVFWVGVYALIALVWCIGLFFYRVWKFVNGSKLIKSEITMVGIWKNIACGILWNIGLFLAMGIFGTICMFFYQVWVHVNEPPISESMRARITANQIIFSGKEVDMSNCNFEVGERVQFNEQTK